MADERLKNHPSGQEEHDKEALRQIILRLEELLRQDEQKLASQGGKDLEAEKADGELAAHEIDAKVAAAISQLFEHIKFDVSFDAHLRHLNTAEHDQVAVQQQDLERLQQSFLDLSRQYDPKNPDSKVAAELSRLRTEIESAQRFIEEDIKKRDANKNKQGQEQKELLAELEQIKKILLENYSKVTDKELLVDELFVWMNSQDTLAATLDLRKNIEIKPSLKLRQRYFENIGWVKQEDLKTLREKWSKIKPLAERISGLRQVIEEYKGKL